jgi:endonuclease/exonuclease/phosphatase family metal-dependent hydrolase
MLRLLTYNVLEGALPDRLPKVLEVIESADADVVAIQEACGWRRKRREVFRRVRRKLGMRGVLAKANSGFDLAVLSRLPILHHENLGLDTDFLHTTLAVDIEAPSGRTFTLFNTHLRPQYPARLDEVKLLLRWTQPCRNRCAAICGDLNSLMAGDQRAEGRIWRDSSLREGPRDVIAKIEQKGWTDCFRERNPRAPGLTLGAGRRVARVDYIFASEPLCERLAACRVLRHPEVRRASDHSPVHADFDI